MADNRTRKQDRKQIKLLQKSIRRLEEEADRERQTHPDGIGSHRYMDLCGEAAELRDMVQRLSQTMDQSADWDTRDAEDYHRVRLEQARKDRRARKQDARDDNAWV